MATDAGEVWSLTETARTMDPRTRDSRRTLSISGSRLASLSGSLMVALKKRLLTVRISTAQEMPWSSADAEPKPVMLISINRLRVGDFLAGEGGHCGGRRGRRRRAGDSGRGD